MEFICPFFNQFPISIINVTQGKQVYDGALSKYVMKHLQTKLLKEGKKKEEAKAEENPTFYSYGKWGSRKVKFINNIKPKYVLII